MTAFKINDILMHNAATDMNSIGLDMKGIKRDIDSVRRSLSGVISYEYYQNIDKSLGLINQNLEFLSQNTVEAARVIEDSKTLYISSDQKISGTMVERRAAATNNVQAAQAYPGQLKYSFTDGFNEKFGMKEVVKSFGNLGKAGKILISSSTAKSWVDWGKIINDSAKAAYDIGKDVKNYQKIGKAIGSKNAQAAFLKKLTGFRKTGYASQCKNPVARFRNNLTNKTSPYNIKDAFSDFTGKRGAFKATAAWAGVVLSGAANAYDNIQEQKASNGSMSTARVVAETITETAVDTAITTAATPIVGAAIAAVTGAVAAPVVVALATGATLAVINGVVKAKTGKSATEFISDGILDAGKAAWDKGKKMVTGAAKAAKSVASWFGKLSRRKN